MASSVPVLAKRCEKLLQALRLPPEERALAETRLAEEISFIRDNKLIPLFKKPVDNPVPVGEALRDESISLAGALYKTVCRTLYPPLPIVDLDDFWGRNEYARSTKSGALSVSHIQELILAGAFGSTAPAMTRLEELSKKALDIASTDWSKERALRLHQLRRIDRAALETKVGKLASFAEYWHPTNHGAGIQIVGQLVDDPKHIKTKSGRPMAFFELYPLEDNLEHDQPRYHIVVWPDGYGKLKAVSPAPTQGDILLVEGSRDYNKGRGYPQLTVGPGDSIRPVRTS